MKKSKSCGCGHEGKEYGNGKKNGKKGYVEIEIKMAVAVKSKSAIARYSPKNSKISGSRRRNSKTELFLLSRVGEPSH